jgi:3-hydroxyisobutyrate dehydrogenase
VKGDLYDLVCNGVELASGSIRIHEVELQKRIFRFLGISDEQAQMRFGFLLEAFRYGPPPHGGIAPGFDRLVAMMAGDGEDLERLRPLLAAMCRQLVPCGAVPGGTLMKTSTALFNIAMITALSEAMNFAARQGLDLDRFNEVLLGSPMASDVARVKAPKIARRDFAAQASVRNVLEVNRLLVEAALESGTHTPLADACLRIHEQALAMGLGDEDMIAVLKAYEASPRVASR